MSLNDAKSDFDSGIKHFEEQKFSLAEENFCHMVKYRNFSSYLYLKYMKDKLNLKISCLSQVEFKSIPEEILKISQSYLNASLVQMKIFKEGYEEDSIWSMYNLVSRGNAHATVLLGQWIESGNISIESLKKILSNKEKKQIFDLSSFYIFALNKIKLSTIFHNPKLLLKINELFFSNLAISDQNFEKLCPKLFKFKNKIVQFSNAIQKNPNGIGVAASIIGKLSSDNNSKILWYTLALESDLKNTTQIDEAIKFVFENIWDSSPSLARYYANFYNIRGYSKLTNSSPQTLLKYILMLYLGVGGDVNIDKGFAHLILLKEIPFNVSDQKIINDLLENGKDEKKFFDVFQANLKKDPYNPILGAFFISLISHIPKVYDGKNEKYMNLVRELLIYFSLDQNTDLDLHMISLFELADYYTRGIGGNKDEIVGIKYLKKAALLGDTGSQKKFIYQVLKDKSKNFSYDEIYDFILNFANQGDSFYQWLMWFLNNSGKIKNPNLELSKSFLLKAADQNSPYAQFDYALLLLSQVNDFDEIRIDNLENFSLKKENLFFHYLNLSAQNGLQRGQFLLNQFVKFEKNYFIKILEKKYHFLKFDLISEKNNKLIIRKIHLSKRSIKVWDSVQRKNKFESNQGYIAALDTHKIKNEELSFQSVLSLDSDKEKDKSDNQDQVDEIFLISDDFVEDPISEIDHHLQDSSILSDEQINEELNYWNEKNKEYQANKNNSIHQSKKKEVDNKENSKFKINRDELDQKVNEFIDDVFGIGNNKFTKYTNKDLKNFLKDLGCKISDGKGENSTEVSFSNNGKLIAETSYHNPHGKADDRLDYGIRNKIKKFLYALNLGID